MFDLLFAALIMISSVLGGMFLDVIDRTLRNRPINWPVVVVSLVFFLCFMCLGIFGIIMLVSNTA